jgi:uncharacterized oligopeptide transporter (OPT) family protein
MTDSAGGLELTVRAVVAGIVIGAFLVTANLYMGLKIGWWDGGNITASILGFAFFAAARPRDRYGALENNLTQVTASSTGAMPATCGLLAAIPALGMLGHRYSTAGLMLFGLALGVLGIVTAMWQRQRLIVGEQLAFPTGRAAGEVIVAMHAEHETGTRRARALVAGVLLAMLVTWLRDGVPSWIPAMSVLPLSLAGSAAAAFTIGIGWSPMMIGAGLVTGWRISISTLGGAVLAWLIAAPWLVKHGYAVADYQALQQWLLWPGVALIVGSAAAALPPVLLAAASVMGARRGGRRVSRAALAVIACAALVVVVLARQLFGLHPAWSIAALAFSVVGMEVCGRAAGATDFAPVGTMAQMAQIAGALFGLHAPASDIAASSIVAADAAQSTQALWAMRAGEDLRASPRHQLVGLVAGCISGAILCVPLYQLLATTYGIGGERLPAPSAQVWRSVAVMATGAQHVKPALVVVAAVAFFLAIILATLERRRPSWPVPSPIALGVGFILPAYYTAAFFVGGVIARLASRRDSSMVTAVGSGLIAGEALIGVLVAVLIALHVLAH